MKINYDKEFENYVVRLDGRKPSMLLHACCAPCSSACLERLTPYFSVTVFFYNPNITDKSEYDHRLNELYRFTSTVYGDSVKVLAGDFTPEKFYSLARGREDLPEGGARCFDCYRLRLEETAKTAKVGLYDCFCTTLTVSPYKNADKLNEIGYELSHIYDVSFVPSDFKKKQGYVRSIQLSKEYDLYRQNYCGCEFSRKCAQNPVDNPPKDTSV